MEKYRPLILIANDDGYQAKGINCIDLRTGELQSTQAIYSLSISHALKKGSSNS